jgi:hypothetical protein
MNETQQQVVLRYRNGRTERAALEGVDMTEQLFRVTREDGEDGQVPFAEIKAVFYPRAAGDAEGEEAAGSTIAVEFADGEIIRGIAQYNPERNGFFLYPLDRSKNDRIFVVNSAIVSIEVERL